MYCKECGSKLPDDALFCDECGAKTQGDNINNSTNSTSNSTNSSSFNQNYSSSFQNQTQNQSDDNMAMFRESEGYTYNYSNQGNSGKAVASLVLGILSLVCCCTGWFGVIFGGIAVALAFSDGSDSGIAKAGKIMGFIGLGLGALAILWAFSENKSSYDEVQRWLEQL